jgi:hypothetical protein
VKKLFACLFAIIILAINVVPCSAATPALSISSNDYTVSPGDTVTVTVGLSANSELGTLTFDVKYNASEFEYISGSVGSVFENSIINVYTAGVVRYAGISTDVVTSGGTVVSLKFKSVANGGKISVSVVEATDASDMSVRVSGSSVTLSCNHARMVWKEKTAATCKKTGTETGTCPCGYTTTRETSKAAHTYTSSKVKKPATCTETGIEVGTCTVCGAAGVESKIPAKGHDYSEWVVKQPATTDAMGIKERFCRNCGETKTQMIPALIEGITPEEPSEEESSTETTTEIEPIYTPEPSTDDYFEIETETTTVPNGIFGNAVGSDIAIIAVIALAALVVVVLVLYIVLIIRQKKK